MFTLDDESCIEGGLCGDILPQFFELVDGIVRVRPEYGEARGDQALADLPRPRRAST
jgi:ferredoxin